MISKTLQISMLLAVAVYFGVLFTLLKRKRLSLKYGLLWIFSGVLMLILTLFPQLLGYFAQIIGIYDPTNALFAVIFFCVIIILMSLTAIVSKMNERIKRLAQSIALLEKYVRERGEESE